MYRNNAINVLSGMRRTGTTAEVEAPARAVLVTLAAATLGAASVVLTCPVRSGWKQRPGKARATTTTPAPGRQLGLNQREKMSRYSHKDRYELFLTILLLY